MNDGNWKRLTKIEVETIGRFQLDSNQHREPGVEIRDRFIYVNKDFVEDFEKAVSEDKWVIVEAITSSSFSDFSREVSIRIKELRKEKEKKYVVKYQMTCDLATEDKGKCSIYNVYFRIIKNYMEEYES